MKRWYLVPVEEGPDWREVKYFKTRYGSGTIICKMWIRDYGRMNLALVLADVTDGQHTELMGYLDVVAFPANIDQQIDTALDTAIAILESLNIPAGWLTADMTYRQALRGLFRLFKLAGRLNAMFGDRIVTSGFTLDSRLNELPVVARQRLAAAAASAGIDTSDVLPSWTLRRALMVMANRWVDPVVKGGEVL